jgi:hypothetical protein
MPLAFSEPTRPVEAHTCSICGGLMQAMPALDGSGYLWLCPRCPDGQPVAGFERAEDVAPSPAASFPPPAQASAPPSSPAKTGTGRLRDLINATPEAIPDSLLEDLPEEARKALSTSGTGKLPPSPVDNHEGLVETMRRQGYVITEDSKGVRLSGSLSPRFTNTSELRPLDVIRLAADMEGGVPAPDKLVRCTKCDAVVPQSSERCQWCGTPLTPDEGNP